MTAYMATRVRLLTTSFLSALAIWIIAAGCNDPVGRNAHLDPTLTSDETQRWIAEEETKGILVAMENYEATYGHLPPAVEYDTSGKPIHSWRFLICRHLFGGMVDFYGQAANSAFTEPWDAPGNRRYFVGPHRPHTEPSWIIDSTRPGQKTRFAAITGAGTAFEEGVRVSRNSIDGDTILFVEVRNSDCHWMKPGGDFEIGTMAKYIDVKNGRGISGRDPEGFIVAFADGDVWTISNDVPFTDLERFFTIESARNHDRERCLRPYRLTAAKVRN